MTVPPDLQGIAEQIMDGVPIGWFSSSKGSSLWMRGYNAVRVDKQLQETAPRKIVLGEVQATLLRGSITYWESSPVKIDYQEDILSFEMGDFSQTTAPNGTYLVLVTPHDRNGIEGVEETTRARISESVAVLTAIFGRNVAFQRLFDNILSLEDLRTSFFSPIMENPNVFPAVTPNDSRIALASNLFLKFAELPPQDRNRIKLALRWYEQAIYDGGIDAFLKFWIAIETLAMPDPTHVGKLENLLGSAYGLNEETVRSFFQIGRIFGLRSRIVHNGELVSMHSGLMQYLDAIFVDLLYATVGWPIERRALAAAATSDFNLKTYLYAIR